MSKLQRDIKRASTAALRGQLDTPENTICELINLLQRVVERWEDGQDDECHLPVSLIERICETIERVEESLK